MNDYICYYLLCGLAYAIVTEYEYKKSADFDDDDYWWFGDLISMVLIGASNTLFWPKCIIDEIALSYFNSKHDDDEV